MKKSSVVKSFVLIASVLTLTACQNGGSSSGSKVEAKKEGAVVAEINGSTITTGDFERELKNLPEYLKAMADTPQGRKEMLDTMVIRELILQQAAKDGVDKGADIEDKMLDLKKRIIVEAFLKKKVETDANISDADMKAFYEKNKEKFKTGDQIKASHILVKNEKDAKDILAKIKAGGNFEELAKKSSVDSSSSKGGDLGWFSKGTMVPAFEKAALALKEGQVSEVVKSDFGFHIIKLTGKRAAGLKPFEEVKEQIKGAMLPSKQQEIFQKIKDELKKNAKVTVKEDVLNTLGEKKGEKKGDEKAAAPKGEPAKAPEKK